MAVWIRTSLRRISLRTNSVRKMGQSVLEYVGYPRAHLSLTLVGKTRMLTLNRMYRQQEYPTDVLAFPMGEVPGATEVFLGDVVICLPVAVSQASAFGNSPDQEILRLIIHGTLHLLGYDHEISKQEAKRMQLKEQSIFQHLTPVPRLLA